MAVDKHAVKKIARLARLQISEEKSELLSADLGNILNWIEQLEEVERTLDKAMQNQNSYYYDLIQGKILQPLKIKVLAKDSFNSLMKSQGKLGGQNKVPRLANDRKIAEGLYRIQPQN